MLIVDAIVLMAEKDLELANSLAVVDIELDLSSQPGLSPPECMDMHAKDHS